jgi:hypothetical protein
MRTPAGAIAFWLRLRRFFASGEGGVDSATNNAGIADLRISVCRAAISSALPCFGTLAS